MSKFKVLVTLPDIPIEALSALTPMCEVIRCRQKPFPTRQEILEKCSGVHAILWCFPEMLDVDVLDAAGSELKIICALSCSIRHIVIKEVRKRNIKLCNTPVVAYDSVANIVIFLMLATTRRFQECKMAIENNEWLFGYKWMLGKDIAGTTVGIVGFDALGKMLVTKLTLFGVKQFLYVGKCVCDTAECKQFAVKCCNLNKLLQDSDFIICCCVAPMQKKKKIIFDEEAFNKMKKNAIFINVANGSCVDHNALAKALQNGTIFGAGIDVTAPEPLSSDHELLTLPNCVITPHIGSATEKTRLAMAKLAVKNIILGLNNEPMLTPVA